MEAKYPDVADRIIAMALESVDYSEEKALKILEIVMQDDKPEKIEQKHEVNEESSVENDAVIPKSQRYFSNFWPKLFIFFKENLSLSSIFSTHF